MISTPKRWSPSTDTPSSAALPCRKNAATGKDAFLDRRTGCVERVFNASLLFLHLDFGGCTDADECHTASKFGGRSWSFSRS